MKYCGEPKKQRYYLNNTKDIIREYLSEDLTRAEIENLFHSFGFNLLNNMKWRKKDIINQFYSQIEWSKQKSVEKIFPLAAKILSDLKSQCANDIAKGKEYRDKFIKLIDGVRKDGADFNKEFEVTWVSQNNIKDNIKNHFASGNNEYKNNLSVKEAHNLKSNNQLTVTMDYLFVTALTEEHQVLNALLMHVAKESKESTDEIRRYDYVTEKKGTLSIAAVSAFEKGAVSMGVYISPLLHSMKPQKVILFGISATVKPAECALGDVPCASQVVSIDDIAVQKGLEFRTEGYQTDPSIRRWIGYLQSSFERYNLWQNECKKLIPKVAKTINSNRRVKIKLPKKINKPHILIGNMAGGPFLLRDADFRKALIKAQDEEKSISVKLKRPAHPRLLSTEMESHGFMRAALEAGIPASVLKGVSDDGDKAKSKLEKKTGGFFRAYACSNAILALLHSINFK
jgi:nucleoside phosphorylase